MPESYYTSYLSIAFGTTEAELTIDARIVLRNFEGEVIEVSGMPMEIRFDIIVTSNGEETGCASVVG